MKKILVAITCMPLIQGCVVQRIMDSQDRQHYSEYLEQVDQTNLEREKSHLPDEKPMAFDEWDGKK
ncbi:MAG TPA: hypothetical protein VGI03_07915 [Verrucomicrobiae bacterium]|jgi:hypothetical protein